MSVGHTSFVRLNILFYLPDGGGVKRAVHFPRPPTTPAMAGPGRLVEARLSPVIG